MSETKYKMYVGVGLVGCDRTEIITVGEIGYTEEEWSDISEEEKDDILGEFYEDWILNHVEGGWTEA